MNKDLYCSAMDHIKEQNHGVDTLLARIEAGEQPKHKTTITKIPPAMRKAAEFAAIAACLAIVSLFIFPLFHNNRIKLPNSSGNVSARVVKNPELDNQVIPQTDLSEEELFKQSDTILSGTVDKIETLEIALGHNVSYRSLITVTTDYVWRGAEYQGSAVKILLPFAIDKKKNTADTDALLSQIRTGMRGIFLMENFTIDSVSSNGDKTLALIDLAPYGISYDSCAFLEKENRIIYHSESFPSLKPIPTLSEVCDYITEMLNKQPTTNVNTTVVDTTTQTDPSGTVTADTTNKTSDKTGTTKPDNTTTSAKPTKYTGPSAEDFDYVYDNNGHYYRIAKDGTKEIVNLPKPSGSTAQPGNFQPDGDWVYYEISSYPETEYDGIYRCHPDGSEFMRLCKFAGTFNFVITDNAIIIQSNHRYLYKMNKDGSDFKKLCDLPQGCINGYFINNNFAYNNQYAYVFETKTDKTYLLQISLSDGSLMAIHEWKSENWLTRTFGKVEGEWIYYSENYDYDGKTEGKIKRIRLNGSEDTTLISSNHVYCDIQTYNGYLYFRYYRDNLLYRMPLAGSSQPEIIQAPNIDTGIYSVQHMVFNCNHIYVECSKGGATLYTFRMNPDGSDATLIC